MAHGHRILTGSSLIGRAALTVMVRKAVRLGVNIGVSICGFESRLPVSGTYARGLFGSVLLW